MSFETPKGRMTCHEEVRQTMQRTCHCRIDADPAFAWGMPEPVRSIGPERMQIPIPIREAR